jgi:autotransporter-associated beta strand protein
MKNKYSLVRVRESRRRFIPGILATAVAFALAINPSQAQTRTWVGAVNNLTNGAWGTTTNWTLGNIPDTNTETAALQADWTGTTPTFALGANRTVNSVIYEDTGATGDLVGTIVTGSTLTLAGSSPFIQTTNSLTINSVLAWGTTAWSKTGANTLTLAGANTGSGEINMDAGFLVVATSNAALGTGVPTWGAGDTARLQINGGLTIGNSLNLSANFTGVAGVGTITHAGTGNAQINGTITVNGQPAGGGMLQGGGANTNLLVINGPFAVGSGVTTMSQRAGFMRYHGGGTWAGTGVKDFLIGGTALLGANNGFMSDATLVMGQYGGQSGAFDLNGFNQTLAGIRFGGSGAADQGNLTLGTGTLTLNGGISVTNGTTPNHTITGTTGSLNLGATAKTFSIADTTSAIDLNITAAITGAGGFDKTGAGLLSMNGTVQGPVTVSAGTLQGLGVYNGGLSLADTTSLTLGTLSTGGALSATSLALSTGNTTLNYNVGPGGDSIALSGALTQAGTTTVNIAPVGGKLAVGTYPLINYTGAGPGAAGFVIGSKPHGSMSIIDTGTAIVLDVASTDALIWKGNVDSFWDVNGATNWDLQSDGTDAAFFQGDEIIFDDTALITGAITLDTGVTVSKLTFNNATAPYAISTSAAAGSITGAADIVKTGSATAMLDVVTTTTGSISVQGGTLDLSHSKGAFNTQSGVSIDAGATLRLSRGEGAFTFNRNITGAGNIVMDAHSTTATATAAGPISVNLTGDNTNFTGNLKLSSTVGAGTGAGSFRLASATAAQLGSSTIDVDNGAQLWVASAQTVANAVTISGVGVWEAAGGTPATLATGADASSPALPTQAYGGIGAFRSEGATFTGAITLDGDAKIGAHGGTGTFTGNITNTNATDDLIIGGGTESHTIVATGDNSGLERIWINGGSITNARTNLLQIGNNATTGTLGSGDVILYTDISSAVLDIRRSDGYTLAQNVIAAHNGTATNLTKSTLRVNSTGTGVTIGANTVDLSDGTNGGTLAVGNAINGSILNINAGAAIEVGYFTVGEANNISATVNQAGGSVAINGIAATANNNLRIGHWSTETSIYNMSGGTLSFNAGAPAATPSGAAELGGGIYVGIDGTGFFNQSGGTVSTNWVVLDNRGNTVAGVNMPSGVDQYNLSAGTLELKSIYGLIARNLSAEFNFSGGTVRNTSGLDVAINTVTNVSGTGAILDTVDTFSTFSLMNDVLGSGTITTQGGGVIELQPDINATRTGVSLGTGTQTISAVLAGTSPVTKLGEGTTTLSSASTYSGATSVNGGILILTGSAVNSDFTIDGAAKIGGEGTVKSLSFGSTAEILINPSTPGALTSAGNVTNAGDIDVVLAGPTSGSGPIKVLNFTGTAPAASNFFLPNDTSYRAATFTVNASDVTLSLGNTNLEWTGSVDGVWNTGATTNWEDSAPAASAFFYGDIITFNDDPAANQVITLSGIQEPGSMIMQNSAISYALTASAGNIIAGGTNLLKSGSNRLTMAGNVANTFSGGTVISQGTIQMQHAGSLGTGSITLGNAATGSANTALYIDTNRTSVALPVLVSNNGSGTATLGSRATVTGTGDNNQFTNITLARDVIFDSNAADRTDYENISGVGNITVTGVARTLFVTANPFVGNVTVNVGVGGTFQTGVATAGNQNYIPDTALLTVNDTPTSTLAEYRLSSAGETVAGLAGNGTVDVNSINGVLTVGFGDTNSTFSGTMVNGGASTLGLSKIGTGTQILTGANTATGAGTVSAGILQIGDGGATGSIGGATTVAAGASVVYNRTGAVTQPALNSAVAGSGVFAINGDATTAVTLGAGGNFSGVVNLNNGTLIFGGTNPTGTNLTPATFNLAAGTTLSNTGASAHGHVGNITMAGGSTWTTGTGTGSYNSENYQLNGTVTVAGGSTTPVVISREATRTDANSGIALRGTRTFDIADITLTSASDLVVSTELEPSDNDAAANQGALIKAGPGTMELAAGISHPYTGATTVNGGALIVNGTLSASAATAASGGTLGGSGTLSMAAIAASGGTVAPGQNGAGILTFGSGLTMDAGSTYAVEITGATSNDRVAVTGALAVNGTIAVTLNGYTPVAGDTFDIADATSTTGTPVFDFTAATLGAGLTWDTSNFATNGTISVMGSSPYDVWAASYGLAGGNAAKGADPDGDGEANLLEFATNSNPTSGSSRSRVYGKMHTLGADNVLTYTVAVRTAATFAAAGSKQEATKDSVKYSIEASDDLSTWSSVVVTEVTGGDATAVRAAITPALPTLDSGWEWRTFRTDDGAAIDAKDFIRLQVSTTP